jgi:SNF2 family DNA or RNA helicase
MRESFDYQKEDLIKFSAILDKYKGVGIFYSMGCGKSHVSIRLAEMLYQTGKTKCTIIIAPKSLTRDWQKMHVPENQTIPASVYRWGEFMPETNKNKVSFTDTAFYEGHRIFIFNIEAFQVINRTMQTLLKGLSALGEPCIILDEASFIKTHDSQRTKNILKMFRGAGGARLALTGTETTKSPLDLYSIMEFVSPGFWGQSWAAFRSRYAILVPVPGGKSWQSMIVGYRNLKELREKIEPLCIWRDIRSVHDLPELTRRVVTVEASQKVMAVYEQLRDDWFHEATNGLAIEIESALTLFGALRQVANGFYPGEDGQLIEDGIPPKLQAILDEIASREIMSEDPNEKIIIWADYRKEIRMICKVLGDKAVPLYGEMSKKEQEDAKDKHRNDPAIRFLVASPGCGGFGLNLQYSCVSLWYSRSLRPDYNWQADARQLRPGQLQPIDIVDFVTENTVDEKILNRLVSQSNLRDGFRAMTIDEIRRLV